MEKSGVSFWGPAMMRRVGAEDMRWESGVAGGMVGPPGVPGFRRGLSMRRNVAVDWFAIHDKKPRTEVRGHRVGEPKDPATRGLP